VICKADFSR